MRWDEVFADLQAQFDAQHEAGIDARIADLAEAEIASTSLADRWCARRGDQLQVRLVDGTDRGGEVVDAAGSWLVLADRGRRVLVPAHAIVWVRGLGSSAPGPGAIARALTIGHVLRALAREQLAVTVHTAAGHHRGRLGRVAADHLDLVSAAGTLAVSYSALISVEST